MSDGSNTTTASASAQLRTPTLRNPRFNGAESASSFVRVLDALIRTDRPEESTAPEPAPSAAADQPESEHAPESDEAADAESQNGDPRESGARNAGPSSDDTENKPDPAGAKATIGVDGASSTTHSIDNRVTDVRSVSEGFIGEAFSTGSIRRELTHAASVDVAAVANEELKTPFNDEKAKVFNQHDGPLWARNPASLRSQGNARGGTADENPGGVQPQRPAQAPSPQGSEPVLQARVERPEPSPIAQAGPGAAEAVRGSSAVAQTTPTATKTEPGQPVSGIVGRSGVLERLTGSAEAARGAVAAVDRSGLHVGQRQAPIGRPASLAPSQQPGSTREALLTSVQRGLASVLTQGGGKMTVVLRPEALGEVRVRLEAKDGVVNARLSASTDAARRTLESGLDSLRSALEARGVRVESLRIDPPLQNQAADSHAQGDRGNSDGAGGGGAHQHQRRDHAPDERTPRADAPHRVANTSGEETLIDSTARGIWTDLGIDAVA